jgi:maleylacetate reductase
VRVCGTPHAQTNAVMLPHSVRLMVGRAPHAIARVARAVGHGGEGAAAAPELVAELTARAGVTRLGELGVEAESIHEVVEAVRHRPELRNMPRPPAPDELRTLIYEAL